MVDNARGAERIATELASVAQALDRIANSIDALCAALTADLGDALRPAPADGAQNKGESHGGAA